MLHIINMTLQKRISRSSHNNVFSTLLEFDLHITEHTMIILVDTLDENRQGKGFTFFKHPENVLQLKPGKKCDQN